MSLSQEREKEIREWVDRQALPWLCALVHELLDDHSDLQGKLAKAREALNNVCFEIEAQYFAAALNVARQTLKELSE